jgi:23S rRNA G2445 N2-methylase RlmL
MARADNLLLVGSPGTNKVMEAELSRLSRRALSRLPGRPRRAGSGTLIYPMDRELALLALRYHRTSTRILAELYRSAADRLEPLYDELVADVTDDDRPWLADGATISVRARNVGAFAAGERQIVGTVKNAIVDGAARRGLTVRVDPKRPDALVTARLQDGALSVSVDLAGQSLSQRGWRGEAGEAPLREHLAAVLLMLARWDPRRELLLDPMCGAGTIAIEAALMAEARPRAVETPTGGLLAGARVADGPLFAGADPVIVCSDRDRGVVAMARRNAAAAGVSDRVDPRVRDLFDIRPGDLPERSGLILANPPYGERLADRDLVSFYRRLGGWCRRFRGFRVAFLVGDGPFARAFGARPKVVKPLANGPIDAHFYLYEF